MFKKILSIKTLILPILLALGLFFSLSSYLFHVPEYIEAATTKVTYPASYEFKIYDGVLKKHVKYGLLDYQSIKNSTELNAAYEDLKRSSPEKLQGKLEQLSFWINAYNLLTIKCIADHYPIEQLRQEPATVYYIVGGKLLSLNQIKDDVLPPLIRTSDWRAIFLLCNGSISAPFIADHAYSPSNLTDEFARATKQFVLNKSNYSIDEKEDTLSISPFYKWNLKYIDEHYPSPFDLVNSYLPQKVDVENAYRNYAMPYDWRINDIAWLRDVLKMKEKQGSVENASTGSTEKGHIK